MPRANITISNFAGGEASPKMRGRYDLPIYPTLSERMLNFISQTQGGGTYRNGTRFVNHTRLNKTAFFYTFQFNDEQSYIMEFTDKKLRFFTNEGFLLETAKNITGITQANPGVVTSASHGYENGDEVYITGVSGMTEVNGKTFIVTNKATNTFELYDVDGNKVNTSGFTAYSSGGTVARIYELDTNYLEAELFQLKFAQRANVMYITSLKHEPKKLTRVSATSFTLSRYDRTADPFTDQKTITGITQADPGVVTATGHGISDGTEVIIDDVTGMTEVNGERYVVTNSTANTFELYDTDGNTVDTSGFTAYTSGGYATETDEFPAAVTFYEDRLAFGGTTNRPQGLFKSRTTDSSGNTRYDDFTLGTDDDHAIITTLASREVNSIRWMVGTDKLMAIGTFGAEFRASASTDSEAITPTNINVRPVTYNGAADQNPVTHDNIILYVQRGKQILRSFEYDVVADSFVSFDRNLIADHITEGNLKQITLQQGRPDVMWAVKEDGELLGLTLQPKENISGWHRHSLSGTSAKVLSVAALPRNNNFDQLWLVVERTIDGNTRRYVEFMEDTPVYPVLEDYFSGASNRVADQQKYWRELFEKQKEYVHLDACATYDGRDTGTNNSATITPGATTGTDVTFTASTFPIFSASDVGREIWKQTIDGEGQGRAEITEFVSTGSVKCEIYEDFDSTDAIAAGRWFLTTDSITGLDHLEGETVDIATDGGVHAQKTVASGAITLDDQASVVHVGLGYRGYIKTMPIEVGGVQGPAQSRLKNVFQLGVLFLHTLGTRIGTDLYNMEAVTDRSAEHFTDRPPPLFSGMRIVTYEDVPGVQKSVIIEQNNPTPCTVLLIDPQVSTAVD